MKYYCEQCGEELVDGDYIIQTCYRHIIHEDCQDDYIDDLVSCEFYNGKLINGELKWGI